MKEYQIQKDRKRVLPSEVYYQCLWVVKDMNRLQEIAGMEFRREMLAEDVLTYGNTAMQESPVAAEAMFKLAVDSVKCVLKGNFFYDMMGLSDRAIRNYWQMT